MSIEKIATNFFLGSNVDAPVTKDKVNEIIDVVNDLTDGDITIDSITPASTLLTVTGDIRLTGDEDIAGTLDVDTIAEHTPTAGVTVDGVLIKDSSVALADGLVSNLSVKIGADQDNGIYGVSDTQLGIAVEGVLVGGANTTGLFTGNIAEQTAAAGVTVDGLVIRDSRIEFNSTGYFGVTKSADTTLTIDETGFIFGNKPTALTLTLPATVVGYSYTIVNIDGSAVINVSPDAADYIGGAGLTKVDNKDLIIPAVKGAYAQVIADGVNGWYIGGGSGTLTKEA